MILNPKLLVVDDERGIVDMIQSYFQTQYDILTAYSGQEALKKVACKPDLILLDINMPGMDGLTVCQQIREHIACPILFLTARIESSDKIIGFQAGADDYIVKLTPQAIGKQINKICKANDLPLVSVHGLRRSFASLGYHLGWPELRTMKFGGWTNIKTVHEHYLHEAQKDMDKSTKKMQKFYSDIEKCSK